MGERVRQENSRSNSLGYYLFQLEMTDITANQSSKRGGAKRMPKLSVQLRNGSRLILLAEGGRSLMETIREAGISELSALCGGSCSCATCHVYLSNPYPERLPAMREGESDLLESSDHRESNSRLSCQVQVSDLLEDSIVTIAPEG